VNSGRGYLQANVQRKRVLRERTALANPNKVGLVIGALTGGWHLLWSLLVLIGWAQPILDFVFWAHMIKPVYFVKPFDPVAAVTLILITAAIGYVFGFVGAVIWNSYYSAKTGQLLAEPLSKKW
jgi:hypothetical protein